MKRLLVIAVAMMLCASVASAQMIGEIGLYADAAGTDLAVSQDHSHEQGHSHERGHSHEHHGSAHPDTLEHHDSSEHDDHFCHCGVHTVALVPPAVAPAAPVSTITVTLYDDRFSSLTVPTSATCLTA